MQPLNPQLYAALKAVFKSVKISNQGIAMLASYLPGLDGRPRLCPSEKGEYYQICCPYCHDTGHHLYINHRWGVRDHMTGTYNRWLAICFLSNCLKDPVNRDDLVQRLDWYNIAAQAGGVLLDEVEEGAGRPVLQAVDLPHDFVPLAALPKGHEARQYLLKRGFKLKELARERGVGYSRHGRPWWKYGRVVIPLHACLAGLGWSVVGWQARAIKPDEKIKYYTLKGTHKSLLLYGLDRVSEDGRPIVIVEGATDVWRAGENAVAILGKDISDEQRMLIRQYLADRPLVVMLDPEASAEAKKVAAAIRETLDLSLLGRSTESRVVIARLPDQRDPGDCTREEIWGAADAALAPKAKKKAKAPSKGSPTKRRDK